MILPSQYHWSPRDRRERILREGLVVYSESVTHNGAETYPYVCLAPEPRSAWRLSGDMEWTSEVELWDLWQVELADSDEVHVRAIYGSALEEVRVRNSIPADRVWWVGEREGLLAV